MTCQKRPIRGQPMQDSNSNRIYLLIRGPIKPLKKCMEGIFEGEKGRYIMKKLLPRLKASRLKKKPKSKKRIKLYAKSIFNKDNAKRMMNISYYRAQAINQKNYEFIEKEKARLSTLPWEKITEKIANYKKLAETKPSTLGKILKGIFEKNKKANLNNKKAINSNITSIIAKPETLMLAYKLIKGNKGAMTPGEEMDRKKYESMDNDQRFLYLRSLSFPDGISLGDIILTSKLLRKGKYIWGTSKRIYIDKPGQPDKKRPITIPPFIDRIIQKAISLILTAIYEPSFEITNRSFGFRPNKSPHDALTALISRKTNGMKLAIEGDIKAAYDTTNRRILLNILRKTIKDKKFMDLIKDRLSYSYLELETGKRFHPSLGIPQGGIDSPYLFNIYMQEFDNFINTKIQRYLHYINTRKNRPIRSFNKNYNSIKALKNKHHRQLSKIKLQLKNENLTLEEINTLKEKLYSQIRLIRKANHRKNKISTAHPHYKEIRFFYTRYADDWIILLNSKKDIALNIKEKITTFLEKKLGLELSAEKTLITDITRRPAKFLGFELKIPGRGPLRKLATEPKHEIQKKKFNLSKRSGLLLWAGLDKQRLIDRFHMKGLCNRIGFPREIPWLSTMEPHIIIERFNSAIRGLAQYYMPIIKYKFHIHRWIYILRYSCLKTLAQKYKTSIKKIFKKYGHNLFNKARQTIRFIIQQKIGKDTYQKSWTLLTYYDIKKQYENSQRTKSLEKTFWDIEKLRKIGDYPMKIGITPNITNEDFLESFTWLSWRTMASFNMPCASCGSDQQIEQHHIKHIRKRAYTLIPEADSFQKIMALRNRKQIPLCQSCHKDLHRGNYSGPPLIKLAPRQKLIDNRIIHIESFIKPGKEYHAKSLIEKGWKKKI